MVKIILILALLQYIYNFIFGYKSNTLMCGIFGMATDKADNLDVNSVHILGIYNIERGKMSCGLSWDGDVQYGLGIDKLYTDFIIDREIKPVKTPIMIGHTRQPSYGMAITEDNAHPFGFGTSKDGEGYEMIFCHNGTLKNHKELAKKYDIDLTEKVMRTSHGGHQYETTRNKIDSEILGEILYKTKTFHVLSEYIGAAALAWTWIDEPNKLYLWSGASKQTKGSSLVTELEERPVNVYCKNENSMFFSSLSDPLSILGANKKDNLQIDYNTVYVITDGDFATAEKYKVSRKNAGQNEEVIHNNTRQSYNRSDYNNYCGWGIYDDDTVETPSKTVTKNKTPVNILEEKPIHPITNYKNKIYFNKLRYWDNNSLINGVYVYVKGWGFKQAGNDMLTATNFMSRIVGLTFNYEIGVFNYNLLNKTGEIPFKKDCNNIQFHYFIDGVLLKSLEDYNRALVLKNNLKYQTDRISTEVISYIAKHPVIDIRVEYSSTALLDGVKFTGNIVELGFEKVYYFNEGLLIKWVKREDLIIKNTTPVIVLPAVMQDPQIPFDKELFNNSIESIKEIENEIEESINEDLETEAVVKELILEAFEKHSEEVSETITELSDWKDNDLVKGALETLNLIAYTLKDFVEIPNKK